MWEMNKKLSAVITFETHWEKKKKNCTCILSLLSCSQNERKWEKLDSQFPDPDYGYEINNLRTIQEIQENLMKLNELTAK